MLVDLARLPVLPQQPTQNPLSPHPLDLRGHTGIGGTLPLTGASVATLALRGEEVPSARTRVNGGGLDDDTAVLDELLDVGARVGVSDLSLLIGVEPDFSLADARNGCGKALLRPEVDHGGYEKNEETDEETSGGLCVDVVGHSELTLFLRGVDRERVGRTGCATAGQRLREQSHSAIAVTLFSATVQLRRSGRTGARPLGRLYLSFPGCHLSAACVLDIAFSWATLRNSMHLRLVSTRAFG